MFHVKKRKGIFPKQIRLYNVKQNAWSVGINITKKCLHRGMRQKKWVKGGSRQLFFFVAEEILRDREGELFSLRSKHDHGVEEGGPGRSWTDDKIIKGKNT